MKFPGMGVPPDHPFIDEFSIINHPAIGVPPFQEDPNMDSYRRHKDT
jgi:hypothetical protein